MNLHEYLKQFHDIPEADLHRLEERMRPATFAKGEYITVPGQVQRELHFVREGVQMSYSEHEKKIHVIAFTYPPGITAIPDSFSLQRPSKYFLSCLTDTRTDRISHEDLLHLFDVSPSIERLFRKMNEVMLAGVLDRHEELHSLNMEERFLAFCRRSPHLLNMVPHKYIASYLGIEPTNFSKLFNKVKI